SFECGQSPENQRACLRARCRVERHCTQTSSQPRVGVGHLLDALEWVVRYDGVIDHRLYAELACVARREAEEIAWHQEIDNVAAAIGEQRAIARDPAHRAGEIGGTVVASLNVF